jgi:predicted enzyme related to lactoylglutathione lyase
VHAQKEGFETHPLPAQEGHEMKRFHVHVAVSDLEQSIYFYSTLFGTDPSVRKNDYAKWMLDDPRVNFAISQRARQPGVNHLGIQVDGADELDALHERLAKADKNFVREIATTCCYANSDKYWITDPQGVAWESFHTLSDAPVYGEHTSSEPAAACCVPLETESAGNPCCVSKSSATASCCTVTVT